MHTNYPQSNFNGVSCSLGLTLLVRNTLRPTPLQPYLNVGGTCLKWRVERLMTLHSLSRGKTPQVRNDVLTLKFEFLSVYITSAPRVK